MYVKLVDKDGKFRVAAQCASFAASNDDGLLLLELPDVTSAVDAIWSHLVKGRSERSLTGTNAHFYSGGVHHQIKLIPSTKYHRDKKITDRLLLVHDGLTRFQYQYLMGGSLDEPSPWFMVAAQQCLPIPLLPHWAPVLWGHALTKGLVTIADTVYGDIAVWKMHAGSSQLDNWVKLIQDLVQAKKLTAEDTI